MERSKFERVDVSPEDEASYREAPDDDWVHELIAMTRPGAEIEFPSRTLAGRVVPFEYDDFS